MSIARWLQDHPTILERAYRLTETALRRVYPVLRPIGTERLDRFLAWGERVTKGPLFDCQMCGMCNLRGTGMTCPMTCPKNLRNGPCGGVRPNGKCEVIPEMDCIWVLAWERASKMETYGVKIMELHAPVDRRLEDTSAWLNMLEGIDQQQPPGWVSSNVILFDLPPAEHDGG